MPVHQTRSLSHRIDPSAVPAVAAESRQAATFEHTVQPSGNFGGGGNHWKPVLVSWEQSDTGHHVLDRDRVVVEEHSLVELVELEMETAALLELPVGHRLVELGDPPGRKIADGVDHAGRADGEHRKAELLEANQHPEMRVLSIGEAQHSLEDVYLELIDEDVEARKQ